MEDIIVPIGVMGIIFFGTVSIIRAFTDYQLRRKLIQLGHVDRQAVSILQKPQDNRLSALKWGLIIFFGGIGLIIISLFNVDGDSPLSFGIEAVCIAIGFLLYYMISQRRPTPSHRTEQLPHQSTSERYADAP